MNSLISTLPKQQTASISFGNPISSTQFTKAFPHKSFGGYVKRALLVRAAAIDVWYRHQKRLSAEEFYQSHVNAIYLGIYTEIFVGVLAGIASISLFGLWL
jgi:hypothetical protein